MNLNNILLSPQLIADLYQHSLVEGIATAVPQKPVIPSLGKAGKGILIVVNKPDVAYLPDSELDFLTKVLTACQLSLADVAIVNWSRLSHQDSSAVIEQFQATAVILFDLTPALFGLSPDLPTYTVHSIADKKFVIAPALHLIEQSKETKGQLWAVLKQLFGL
jgi:hypothetical protein